MPKIKKDTHTLCSAAEKITILACSLETNSKLPTKVNGPQKELLLKSQEVFLYNILDEEVCLELFSNVTPPKADYPYKV